MKFKHSIKSILCLIPLGLPMAAAYGTQSSENHSIQNDSELLISRYAVVCIRNDIEKTINYSFKWGDNEWSNRSIAPGTLRWHSWKYDTPGHSVSPSATIEFDSDFSAAPSRVTYSLQKIALPEETCKGAKIYKFVWDGTTHRFIDLKLTNP